jgi:hypothetical protein
VGEPFAESLFNPAQRLIGFVQRSLPAEINHRPFGYTENPFNSARAGGAYPKGFLIALFLYGNYLILV